jgi:GDP-L-fucose synthase
MKILITGGNGNIAKIIKNNLGSQYELTNLTRSDLDILNQFDIEKYLSVNNFEILVHTAISGGRRTKEENGDVTHINLLMLENLLKHADKFKMIINFDSGAIYDRNTNILNRKECEINTIPTDYYGFSKYLIYHRSLQFKNMYNFRIFNIFHPNEESDRFIKMCFNTKKNNQQVTIFEDKYFDFMYEEDFIKIVKYYFDNVSNPTKLLKTINICYEKKYKLSEIARLIIKNNDQIIIKNSDPSNKNYSGDNTLLKTLDIEISNLEDSLIKYEEKTEVNSVKIL